MQRQIKFLKREQEVLHASSFFSLTLRYAEQIEREGVEVGESAACIFFLAGCQNEAAADADMDDGANINNVAQLGKHFDQQQQQQQIEEKLYKFFEAFLVQLAGICCA